MPTMSPWLSLVVAAAMLWPAVYVLWRRTRFALAFVITVAVVHVAAAIALIASVVRPDRVLGLVVADAVLTVCVLLGVTLLGYGFVLRRGDSSDGDGTTMTIFKREVVVPNWYAVTFWLFLLWAATLVLWAVSRSVHVQRAVSGYTRAQTVWDRLTDVWGLAVTVVIILAVVGFTGKSVADKEWTDARLGLGCLGVIVVIALILFLIGGWALVLKMRISVG
jgi:hypothetical protein